MGTIHTDMNTDSTRTRTIKEWADKFGINPDTARRTIARKSGRTLGQLSELTPDEWNAWRPGKTAKRPARTVRTAEPTAPRKEAKPRFTLPDISAVRRALLDIILVGIVVGHAGLIWYDCADLWGVPGQIGGGLAFFIIVAAVMLATDPAKNITSQIALVFAFLVDFAAWWVHYPVFQTYSVSDEITGVLCAFLCLMSFGALLIYRHQKNN